MLFVTLFWGINFPAGKHATQHIDPYLITGTRILVAAAVFPLLLDRERRASLFRLETMRRLLPLGLLGVAINQILFLAGLQKTTPGHSAVLITMIPIFVALLARLFLKETLTTAAWMGILLAAGGASGVVLSGTAAQRDATLLGDALTLASTLAFASYTVLGRRRTRDFTALEIGSGAFLGAAPFAVGMLVFGVARQEWTGIPAAAWGSVAYMVFFSTIFCYSLHLWALTRLKAAEVAVFTNAQPLIGTGLSALFGMESPGPLFLASASLAIAGVLLVQIRRTGAPV